MRATLVLSSLNEGERLWKTVRSCLETTEGLDCELLVADDGSEDGSLDEVRNRFPDVRIVAHEGRRGVASTKDLGARRALGDVVVFLDGHCKPEPARSSVWSPTSRGSTAGRLLHPAWRRSILTVGRTNRTSAMAIGWS